MFTTHSKTLVSYAALPLFTLLHGCAMDTESVAPEAAPVASEQLLLQGLPQLGYANTTAALTASEEELTTEKASDIDPLLALAQGRWVGTCDILLPGRDQPVISIGVERITQPTDTPNEYEWTLIYRTPDSEQVRPYTMIANPATPGRYVLDENNGIRLTHALLPGGVLVSEFSVAGTRLMTREEFQGNKYDFEINVTSVAPELSSAVEGFVVDSFRVLSQQKCTLHRQGPREL